MESISGYFLSHGSLAAWVIGAIFLLLFIGYFGLPFLVWAVVGLALLIGFGASSPVLLTFVGLALVFLITQMLIIPIKY